MESGPYGFLSFTSYSIISLALLVIWIFVIVWVYRDAERRGMNRVLWALLVFIGNLIGLLIYLIVRPNNLAPPRKEASSQPSSQKCPNCHLPLSPSYIFCRNCGASLQPVCPRCKKTIEKDWNICPYCGEKLKD